MSAYVIQLNNINSTSEPFYSMEEEQDANSIHEPIQISSMDTTSNFTDEKQLSNLTQIDVKAESHFLLKQLTDNILGLARRLSIDAQAVYEACQPFLSNINLSHLSSDEEIIAAFEVGTTCFSKLLGTVKHSMTVERIDLSQLTPTNHINHQTRGSNRTNIKPMPKHDSIHCDAPSPTKPLKTTHHPRYLKEFTATISAPVRCINSGQRDSIEIKIPLIDCNNPLYLVIELQDLNEQSHCSKVVVPEQTRATNEILINNNDLKCLRFDRCPPNYGYDLETRRIYSEITREERQHLKKEIKIHIINLYQTNGINQALVRDQLLKQFKLVLYLCTVEDTIHKRVSKMFHANIMEKVAEKKPAAKRPRRITEKRAKKSAKKVTKQLIDVH
ncbi:unnamed protein product [Rotaria magnacalcarata]|uniref:Uncharacterized protein n=2 Tax=Rotaria magnacalcarata TaxID=392030 RepID=A0A816LTP9_9BILA|nr:unnamed protein product [Rotaria magnacalcarata]